MAELSYEDVRRATQNVVSNLQTVIGDIRNNVQSTRNDITRLSPQDFQYRLLNLQRALDNLLQYMQRIDAYLQNNQNLAAGMQQTQQLVLRVEQRLVNTEHIVAETTRYLEVIHAQMVQLTEMNQAIRTATTSK
jgi:uncharacterized UPF0160 family protein